ncbi:MAG: alpha-ketoglutarate decarboxylase [Maribacter sp.]|nr:alpha-ketoglutarate decarboxylase [Maribacter sp.]
MPYRKIVWSLFFVFFVFAGRAQNIYNSTDFWRNVRFGGGIGLGFTKGGFNATLSPSAIYLFNNQFATGPGLSFSYAKFSNDKLLAYGGSWISLYNPFKFLQVSADFEELRINRTYDDGTLRLENNYWSPALFLGIGFVNQNFTVGVRYDALYDHNKSIYANAWMPFVRVYF